MSGRSIPATRAIGPHGSGLVLIRRPGRRIDRLTAPAVARRSLLSGLAMSGLAIPPAAPIRAIERRGGRLLAARDGAGEPGERAGHGALRASWPSRPSAGAGGQARCIASLSDHAAIGLAAARRARCRREGGTEEKRLSRAISFRCPRDDDWLVPPLRAMRWPCAMALRGRQARSGRGRRHAAPGADRNRHRGGARVLAAGRDELQRGLSPTARAKPPLARLRPRALPARVTRAMQSKAMRWTRVRHASRSRAAEREYGIRTSACTLRHGAPRRTSARRHPSAA